MVELTDRDYHLMEKLRGGLRLSRGTIYSAQKLEQLGYIIIEDNEDGFDSIADLTQRGRQVLQEEKSSRHAQIKTIDELLPAWE